MASRKQVTIDSKLVTKAVSALLTHQENVRNNESQKTAKKNLFVEDDIVQLVITIKTVLGKSKVKPIPIPLPNPLYDESAELCLFLKDSPELKAKIKTECENMKLKVITLSKLRANYKQYEDKRKLSASHDLFLTDDSILTFLPKALGKPFFKKKKQPVPIRVDKGSVSKAIENARNSTFLYLSSGSCISVRIARTNLTVEQIVQNIEAAIPEIVSRISKKWNNIQSISIKTTDSVALPFYNSLPTPVFRIEANTNGAEDSEGKEEASEKAEVKETKKRKKEADESPNGKKRKQETKEPVKEKEPESENKKRKVEENKEAKKNEKKEVTPAQKKATTPAKVEVASKPVTPKEQKKPATPKPEEVKAEKKGKQAETPKATQPAKATPTSKSPAPKKAKK